MKNLRLLFTLLFVAAFASFSFGQISGTSHDFSGAAWNPGGEICIVCHTPHNADVLTVTTAPLWNHEVTGASGTYTVYTSSTLDADGGTTLGQPDNESLLCLSCHDGTVGLGNFGGATGTPALGVGLSTNVGIILTDDHPISFVYDGTLATLDGGLHDPATATGITGTIYEDMLFSGRLECASCHDVHDDTNGFFLIMANTASALCLTCHDK